MTITASASFPSYKSRHSGWGERVGASHGELRVESRHWFWATLVLTSITLVALVFTLWELVENRLFRDIDYVSLHYLYISRGITSSALLALWAAWFVSRDRRKAEEVLRESQEHYRGLLEAAPSAVTLFDSDLIVREWNAAAERLYGYPSKDVSGSRLPTLNGSNRAELQALMQKVAQGKAILEV